MSLVSSVSFEYLDNLEKLDLSHNHLTSIGPGVFRGLSRLRLLYLHNNRLSVVQQGSLDMLPGLEVRRNSSLMTKLPVRCLSDNHHPFVPADAPAEQQQHLSD